MSGTLEHHLPYTAKVQETVGSKIGAFFESMGIEPEVYGNLVVAYNEEYVLPDHTLQTWLIMIGFAIVAYFMTRKMDLVPSSGQSILEVPVLGLKNMVESVVGHGTEKHVPFMFTVACFIFLSNMIGLFPYNMSPTSNLNVTFGLGLLSFFYYNFHGLKETGFVSYVGHFFGPKLPWYMTPVNLIMFPIELISHIARPLSLGIRLFGNIMGEDLVLMILIGLTASLAPVIFFVPLPMMMLMVFTGFLQAFVFVLLSIVYLAGAVAHDDH